MLSKIMLCFKNENVRRSNHSPGTLAPLDFLSRATVVAQTSVIRPLTQLSQKPLHGSKPKFMESYLSTIFPDIYFLFSKFSLFTQFFFSFSLTWDPMGAKFQNAITYPVFIRSNFMVNKLVMSR